MYCCCNRGRFFVARAKGILSLRTCAIAQRGKGSLAETELEEVFLTRGLHSIFIRVVEGEKAAEATGKVGKSNRRKTKET